MAMNDKKATDLSNDLNINLILSIVNVYHRHTEVSHYLGQMIYDPLHFFRFFLPPHARYKQNKTKSHF